MIKTSIIVSTYNEEKSIGGVLEDILDVIDRSYEVIVVDDGSTDSTYERAMEFDVKMVRHKRNMGKGVAMMSGVKEARGEYLVFIDADNTYPAYNIPRIIENLDEGYDMVVGSRIIQFNEMPRINKIGNKILSWMLKFIYRSKAADPFSGLYGIRKEHLQNMDIVSKGFEIETEITIKSSRMNLNVLNIPIIYGERIGVTKLNPLKDGYKIFRTILNSMMLYSPTMLFTAPGVVMLTFGLIAMLLLSGGGLKISVVWLSFHSLVLGSLISILGLQLIVTGISSKMYAALHKFSTLDLPTRFFLRYNGVRMMKILGTVSFLIGSYMGARIVQNWISTEFGAIAALESAIIASTLIILGIQAIFSSLFLSIFAGELDRIVENENNKP